MNFYPRRRRTAPTIIIISLIDVLLVMLVFLLFTTTLRNTPSVKLDLPESSEAVRSGASTEKPPLIVSIRRESPRFFVGEHAVAPEQLPGELQSARQKDPAMRLALRADKDAAWGDIVLLRELARQAAISNVTVYTKPRE